MVVFTNIKGGLAVDESLAGIQTRSGTGVRAIADYPGQRRVGTIDTVVGITDWRGLLPVADCDHHLLRRAMIPVQHPQQLR